MLESLNKIKIANPVDLIISQIRDLISSGAVQPGEKLPPERKLAVHLGVSRSQVREAINKLQFYGILKVLPQSGTIVTGLGIGAIEGLITNILKIEETDFSSLVDTRIILEKELARLAALNRTEEDIISMTEALDAYKKRLGLEVGAVEEDLLFHLKIAEASKNSVLKSMMLTIAPDLMKSLVERKICAGDNSIITIEQHQQILDNIVAQDAEGAVRAMENHLSDLIKLSDNYQTRTN